MKCVNEINAYECVKLKNIPSWSPSSDPVKFSFISCPSSFNFLKSLSFHYNPLMNILLSFGVKILCKNLLACCFSNFAKAYSHFFP